MKEKNNRIAQAVWLLVMGIIVIFLVSCASVPRYSGKENALLVIPILNDYVIEDKVWGWYELHLTNIDTEQTIRTVEIPRKGDYILVRNLKPGRYYISKSRFRYAKDVYGSEIEHSVDETGVILRAGEMAFTPMRFGQTNIQHPGEDRPRMLRDFQPDPDGVYQEFVYEQLLEKFPEEMATWDVTSFIGQ